MRQKDGIQQITILQKTEIYGRAHTKYSETNVRNIITL